MKISELYEDALANMSEDDIIELIKRDCQPFLDSNAEGLLYRGMQSKPDRIFKQAVRTDRKPRNMKYEIHDAIDAWFKKKFGFKARSETVFVTGDHRDARTYGRAYAVLPIGDFEFVWSPEVGDMFIMFHNADPAGVAADLDGYGYKNDDLNAAIESDYEIMLKCKEYYAIPIQDSQEGRDFFRRLKGN